MLDSVVFCTSAVLGDRYSHFIRYRSDAQFTFAHLDLIVAVFVCFCLFNLDGVAYRTLRYVGHTSGCLCSCFSFYKTVSGDCYFRSGQRCSVVNFAVTYTGQGYLSLADRKRSVFNFEGYLCKVGVVVREIFCFQLHVVASGVDSLHFCVSAEGEVGCFIQEIADLCHIITRYDMLGSIVCLGSAVLSDRYGHFIRYRSDGQFAFVLLDLIVAVLVCFCLFDLDAVGYRALRYVGHASGCLCSCLSFYKTVSVYCYFRTGQRCSVINLAVTCTGQGYLSRADRKLSVFDFEGYLCKVSVVIGKIFCFQLHVVASGVDSLHFCFSVEGEVGCFIQGIADLCHIITRYAMLGSIVCLGSAVLGDRYGHFIRYRSDGQFAFVLLDLIVAVLVCFCLFDLDGVGYRALRYVGHTSGCLCSCLTFYKTISGDCYFRFGQRCSVVNLAGSLTAQFYRSRGDRKCSVYSLDAVVVSCIRYCVLSDLIVSCNGVFHVGHASGYHCRYFIAGRKDVFSFCIGFDLCSVIGYRIASITVGTSVIRPAIA